MNKTKVNPALSHYAIISSAAFGNFMYSFSVNIIIDLTNKNTNGRREKWNTQCGAVAVTVIESSITTLGCYIFLDLYGVFIIFNDFIEGPAIPTLTSRGNDGHAES